MRTEPDAAGAFRLKSRTGLPSAWVAPEAPDAEFVALDVETNGSTPFWIIEIGAERFAMHGSLALFDTLVECRAPINSFARRRHRIDRSMLDGAPSFHDARRAFLRFSHGAPLVEHSHDA